MTGAYSKPIVVSNGGSDVQLDRVPLSDNLGATAYGEDWLQDLLYRHSQALPITEINPSFAGLIPICRELRTPAGPLDVLYATPEGRLVVLEAKLWRNPEARRKVVAQIFDYAKELSHWTYETLDAKVREASRREGAERSLFDIVSNKHRDIDEAWFYDSVSRSLRRGDMLLLIAGDGIHENVGAITNFIESHGTFHFAFGLVEMAIYRMPDGSHLVQPRVVAHSTIVRRIVVDIRDGQLVEPEEEDSGDEATAAMSSSDLEEQRRRFREFWQEWLEKYPLDDKSQPLKKPTTWTNQFFDMPKGSAGRVAAVAGDRSGTVGIYLSFPRQPVSDQIYDELLSDKIHINDEIGQPLEWKRDDRYQAVSIWHKLGDRLMPEHKEEAQRWLGDVLNRFINAFRPRIEASLRELQQV